MLYFKPARNHGRREIFQRLKKKKKRRRNKAFEIIERERIRMFGAE